MALKFYDNIDLQGNQLLNAVLHTSATAPSIAVEGQAWYDTDENILKLYNGSEWVASATELTVDPGSAGFVSITDGVLSFHNLAITDVTVDATYTSLAAFVAAEYTVGNEFQEGDMIILTSATDQQHRSYIHNGGVAGDENDFTRLQTDIDTSTIREALSGTSGVSYNSSTGAISADVDDTTVQVGGSGLEVKDAGISTAKLADDSVTKAKIGADVAGIGLGQNADGSLEVNVDASTIVVNGDSIEVDTDVVANAIAGEGLTYNAGVLDVDSNDTLTSIGDGATLTHTVNHSLNTKLFKVEVIKESTGETICCNPIRTLTNVQIYVNPPLATDDGKVIITKYNV